MSDPCWQLSSSHVSAFLCVFLSVLSGRKSAEVPSSVEKLPSGRF